MLYLIGENIDKDRGYYGVEKGTLIQIMRGVYIDAADDIDDTLFKHAIRIARYLYPKTYLHGFSAFALAPTRDGRLFLAGRRGQRTRLRSLELVQTRAPEQPETESVTLMDPQGELTVPRAAPVLQFLEGFRGRSEAGAALGPAEKDKIAARLKEDYGADGAVQRLWKLGLANGWRVEAEAAEKFIAAPRRDAPSAETEFFVGWHGDRIGRLLFDGAGWRWDADDSVAPNPVRAGAPGVLPAFIESLLPEGWLKDVVDAKSPREGIASGKRYLSNMVVSDTEEDIATAPEDRLGASLKSWSENGLFTGRYEGPTAALQQELEERLAAIYANEDTPRLSGVQIKVPMTLAAGGLLTPATDGPFTHILKPSPGGDLLDLPPVEHACLAAAAACGLKTSRNALVPLGDGLPDALIVERFDIRRAGRDKRRFALEDMTSVRGVPARDKYEGSLEQAARAMRGVSTEPETDLERFFRRALFVWLIADGDWHLKNMAVLRIAGAGSQRFDTVALAPVYDCVTTRAFARFRNDKLALTLNGKKHALQLRDFRQFAATIGVGADKGEIMVEDFLDRFQRHLGTQKPTNETVNRAQAIWGERVKALAGEV